MTTSSPWTPHSALTPFVSTLFALLYALYILAYPPDHRKLSLLLLALPITYAFKYHLDLTPNASVNDTFGRFLYIWFAHMSYEIAILEFSPSPANSIARKRGGRLREAYKVLFDRNHTQRRQSTLGPQRRHEFSRLSFLLRHITKVITLYLAMASWYIFLDTPSFTMSSDYGFEKAFFFRRLPSSLNMRELRVRFNFTFQWCIINMLMYDTYHSIFAVLFVGCGLDAPNEWSMSLFGSVSEAWSVRRYWGKHWHNYIYHSFSAHVKIFTRGWLGLKRGRLQTRLLENILVFAASGLMHSLVRWMQDGSDGDIWCIAIWYTAQMLPIVIENVAQNIWGRVKEKLVITSNRSVRELERLVGYMWVVGWFMWSVPKQIHTKNEWTDRLMRRRYPVTYASEMELEKMSSEF
ncbi:hypothetical protein P153DRAFT_343390 [Dothidotthia symphoricarpi CBS 119687]|uniref:Wax synthase domain-containing protein n=1 Tax=Dothidotthia symphoricarpi CBS 119687 TaxID=1392245 RepID=A0A6A6A8I3_9PLEO|nr:uncharacterized protein P153DRAFT_343390 [Dothidotthia symphoricarpi CBS 119687]KAF2128169.1 hypothetical protein P153DRAFT_343390 [Dothidotthia symphoricarpi CBS 119687]